MNVVPLHSDTYECQFWFITEILQSIGFLKKMFHQKQNIQSLMIHYINQNNVDISLGQIECQI